MKEGDVARDSRSTYHSKVWRKDACNLCAQTGCAGCDECNFLH